MAVDELILALGRKLKDAGIDFSVAPDGARAVRLNFPRALEWRQNDMLNRWLLGQRSVADFDSDDQGVAWQIRLA